MSLPTLLSTFVRWQVSSAGHFRPVASFVRRTLPSGGKFRPLDTSVRFWTTLALLAVFYLKDGFVRFNLTPQEITPPLSLVTYYRRAGHFCPVPYFKITLAPESRTLLSTFVRFSYSGIILRRGFALIEGIVLFP